jgi:tetratricopeptide (TPR) repeat protein
VTAQAGDRKRHAFQLFETGHYRESYDLCIALLKESAEPQVEILAATNLFYLDRIDEAELHFRDIARKMPGSSHVHGFLGRVLQKKGDESALAEFSTAVQLDPDNLDALRNYIKCLLRACDYRRSLPAQRRLLDRSKREDDCRDLITTLVVVGEGREALELYGKFPAMKTSSDPLYIDALTAAGEYLKAAEFALAEFERSHDTQFLRKYLGVLRRYDPRSALAEYKRVISGLADKAVREDYLRVLVSEGCNDEALIVCRTLTAQDDDPGTRLIECRVLASLGERDRAKETYEEVIRNGIGSTGTDEFLLGALSSYREFLMMYYPKKEMIAAFLSIVSSSVNPVCLFETGRFYELLGDITEARAWFYRAYRSDYLAGGLEYAKFLSRHQEWRECEKVMLYILSSVKKTQDIIRIAGVTAGSTGIIHQNKRLLERLIERLEERQASLSADGLEFLAVAYLVAGTNAVGEGDYTGCKRYCLKGLDILPAYSSCISTGDFMAVLGRCKERAVVDPPVMAGTAAERISRRPEEPSARLTGLDKGEEKVLEFMKLHRRATEADLRKLLGTRRVAGIVNRLMAKASSQGVKIITKKGTGEQGEIYEYTGA